MDDALRSQEEDAVEEKEVVLHLKIQNARRDLLSGSEQLR